MYCFGNLLCTNTGHAVGSRSPAVSRSCRGGFMAVLSISAASMTCRGGFHATVSGRLSGFHSGLGRLSGFHDGLGRLSSFYGGLGISAVSSAVISSFLRCSFNRQFFQLKLQLLLHLRLDLSASCSGTPNPANPGPSPRRTCAEIPLWWQRAGRPGRVQGGPTLVYQVVFPTRRFTAWSDLTPRIFSISILVTGCL